MTQEQPVVTNVLQMFDGRPNDLDRVLAAVGISLSSSSSDDDDDDDGNLIMTDDNNINLITTDDDDGDDEYDDDDGSLIMTDDDDGSWITTDDDDDDLDRVLVQSKIPQNDLKELDKREGLLMSRLLF